MAIRISGMNSGLDTESIVSALVSGYKSKADKAKKAQTKLSWKQDAWKSVNKKVYSLYNSLDKLRFTSAYSLKKTTVSDATKATVSASGSAVNGTQTLKIKQLATAGYLTGGKLGDDVTGSSKLSDLGYSSGNGTIRVNGRDVAVDENTTIDDFVSKLNDAGVKASFDSGNKRIFISSKDSGVANDFTLDAGDNAGLNAMMKLGLYTKPTAGSAQYTSYSALAAYDGKSDDELTSILDGLNNAHSTIDAAAADNATRTARVNYAESYARLQDLYQNEDSRISGYSKKLDSLLNRGPEKAAYVDPQGGKFYTRMEEVKDDDGNITGYKYFEGDDDTTGREYSLEENKNIKTYEERRQDLAYWAKLTTKSTDEDGNVTYSDNDGKYAQFLADRAVVQAYEGDSANAADVTAVKTAYNNHTLTSEDGLIATDKSNIEANDAAIATANATIKADQALDEYRDLSVADLKARIATAVEALQGEDTTGTASATATRVNGKDAIIELNNAEFTSSSNSFNINGLTINATGTTGDDEITITTATDVDGIYDKVKDFLSEYNEVVNYLSELYNADSAKGYDPLTDDEKEAMTDTQVEKWEQKIKDSLLRRDTNVNSIISTLTNSMMKSYSVNGKNYSLASFGISTLGYFGAAANEKYAYHIDGDEDDVNTSSKTDKLKAAINNDPEAVTDFLKQLTDGLYQSLGNSMKSTSLRSAYTVYNDKEMATEYSDYTKTIAKWEERMSAAEEKYFKQFTAMEKALANLQSNSSSLSGLLGG